MNIVRQEIRTGILVIFSVAVLVTLMLYLGAPGVFIPQKTFYIYVDNVAGLKQGADVALAGRRIGQVIRLYSPVPEAERPTPSTEVKIEVKVNKDALVYNRVKVLVAQSGLLGEVFLDFTSGAESSGMAPEGSKFLGEKPAGLDQAVPMVLEKIDPALTKATETLDALQKTADNLTKLTSDDGEIPAMLAEFRKVGTNLDELSASSGPLKQSLENVADLTAKDGHLWKSLSNLEKFTSNLADNRDIEKTLANAREATGQLNSTLNDLRFKFADIAENLNQATDTVKRQPWRLVWPSTKKYPDEAKATPAPRKPKRTVKVPAPPLP